MKESELRYEIISSLLQADSPLGLSELAARHGSTERDMLPILRGLVNENLVVEGRLLPDTTNPQYFWRTRWASELRRHVTNMKQKLLSAVDPTGIRDKQSVDINSKPVQAFNDFIINEYEPPRDKRLLVFLQCSVRRPFSSSPSHASMRRAVSVATGFDPSIDFEDCPVHVVVLASKVGPVPYELEDVYPANVRAGGVKHFGNAYYAHVKPILAGRIAEYVTAHGENYDQITTFTEGRYGEVMEAAKRIASVDFRVLPARYGPEIKRIGRSIPIRYWEKYWIQLYLEIVSWLNPVQQERAGTRLKALDVEYRNVTTPLFGK